MPTIFDYWIVNIDEVNDIEASYDFDITGMSASEELDILEEEGY